MIPDGDDSQMNRKWRGLAILTLVATGTVACGASAASKTVERNISTSSSGRGASGDAVGLRRFVALYERAPIYDLIDTNLPRSIEDIVLTHPCDGYVNGTVTGIERLTQRVPLGTGSDGEPPDFWLDELAVGLRVTAGSSSLRSGRSFAPGSEVVVRLPVWQGKPSASMDEAEAKVVGPLLSSPPIGAQVQVFVGQIDGANIVAPCWGGDGVVGGQPDGTGVTSFGSFAATGSVYGASTMDEIERRTELALETPPRGS